MTLQWLMISVGLFGGVVGAFLYVMAISGMRASSDEYEATAVYLGFSLILLFMGFLCAAIGAVEYFEVQ